MKNKLSFIFIFTLCIALSLTALQRKIIDLLPWDLLMRHFSILPLSFYPVYLIFRKKETIIWRKPEPRWQSMQDSGLCLCVHKS